MTADQLRALGPAFTAFLRPFERFFDSAKCVPHFRTYTHGLLSDLPRKTAEPLALAAGTPPRCLQQFLKVCLWDHAGLTDGLQQTVQDTVADLPADPVGTVGILDETSARKQGTKTPGVQRQYLGCIGKVDNGIVSVHLAVARGSFKALLDSELFLPEVVGRRPGPLPGSGHPRRRSLPAEVADRHRIVGSGRAERLAL